MIKQLHPGKCRYVTDKVLKFCHNVDWILEEKLDGHRGLLHCGGELDRAYLTSKRKSAVTGMFCEKGENVPHIIEQAQRLSRGNSLGYTVLDGEILVPGHPFESVQSVMGAKPERAILWQEDNGRAAYFVYDILFFDGKDARDEPYYARQELLNCILRGREHSSSNLCSIRRHQSIDARGGFQEFFDAVIKKGGEGIVLKHVWGRYGKNVWKLKAGYLDNSLDFDVVIHGFREGKGKFKELIGAIDFSCYETRKGANTLIPVGRCSGMPDGAVQWAYAGSRSKGSGNHLVMSPACVGEPGTRSWFTFYSKQLIGKVIEVRSSGLTAKGKLRHPRFVRMRPDKNASQCPMPRDQLKE